MDGVVRRIGARSPRGRRRGGANATAPPAGRRGCPHRSRQRVAIDALAVFDENGPPRERAVAHHRVRTHREGEHRDGPGRSRRARRAGGSAPKRERERGVVAREGSAFRVGTSETREGKKNRREGTATVEKRFEIRERRFRRLPRRRSRPTHRGGPHPPAPACHGRGVRGVRETSRGERRAASHRGVLRGAVPRAVRLAAPIRRAGASSPRALGATSSAPPPEPRPIPSLPPIPPPPNPTFLAPQPSCPTCGAPLREFTSDAVDADGTPSPLAPRRVRRERVVFHLLVDPARADATRRLCADLFDVPLHRAKLLARGGELRGEPDVAAASARGAPILFVGARSADAKALESLPRRAALILAAFARTLLAPIRRRAWNPIARPALLAAAPAARHAWWLAETFVRSMHPGWTNPYERVSGAADASDGGGEIDRRHRRPPPRPADPGRGPHQFR